MWNFLRGSSYTVYDIDKASTGKPRKLHEDWPFVAKMGFDRIDAAFSAGPCCSKSGEDLRRKFYVFRKHQYLRVDFDQAMRSVGLASDIKSKLAAGIPSSELIEAQNALNQLLGEVIDPGYPKEISEGFPGVTFESVDAVLNPGGGEIYFFSGDRFIRFNLAKNRADEGYPELIKKRWFGLTFDRIDAAIYWGNGKAYFFMDDQHIRYDMVTYRADPGYPKAIIGSYVEDWKFFD